VRRPRDVAMLAVLRRVVLRRHVPARGVGRTQGGVRGGGGLRNSAPRRASRIAFSVEVHEAAAGALRNLGVDM
jgi:hypothetical protein